MTTQQATDFGYFAGQSVASGIRPNEPIVALEAAMDATAWSNLSKINGLMPKFSDILIFDTRVMRNPLDALFRKIDEQYGAATEMAIFSTGAVNKKNPMSTCFPKGNVAMVDQFAMSNWAYDIDISIGDREINKAVMSAENVNRYVAEKMRTPLKTLAIDRYRSMNQLLSDIVAGTRAIVSTDASDGIGTAVTYSVTTDGYAGDVIDEAIYVPEVTVGSLVAFPDAQSALTLAQDIEGVIADMYLDTSNFSALGNKTCLMDRPYLIMETKTLNAMDNIFEMNASYKAFPTVSAREWLGRVADILEVDAFASLPTAASTADKRLGAVIIDKDACKEFVYHNSVEADRCVKQRATGYSYQGESAFAIFKGVPSCAITFSTKEPEDGES